MSTSSESLFSTPSERDVRHDINTVQQRWSNEQRRRRRRAVLWAIPVALLLTGIYFSLAYFYWDIPGFWLFHEEEEFNPPTPKKPTEFLGNRDALIKFSCLKQTTTDRLRSMLEEVVDRKPSEFSLEYQTNSNYTDEQIRDFSETGDFQLRINGKQEFDWTQPDGTVRKISLAQDKLSNLSFNDLKRFIIWLHAETYGEPLVPVIDIDPADEPSKEPPKSELEKANETLNIPNVVPLGV